MAKVPPPRGKGEPPTASYTLGNLNKPESEVLVPLNFKVPESFRRDFKITAAQCGKDMVQQFYEAYALLKESLKEENTK
jgi:hypothetical protein